MRVTDMRTVDIAAWRFDFDLTFAVLVANADGTVYHRYGSRDHSDAMSWMSMKSLVTLLQGSLEDHAAYAKNPKPPKKASPRTLEESPAFAREDKKKRRDCVHCHMVGEFERRDLQEAKRWSMADIWIHPPPSRIGLEMDGEDQTLAKKVERGSPAHKAGVRDGDRVVRIGEQRIRSIADIQWVLHEAGNKEAKLPIFFEHDGAGKEGTLKLGKSWRVGTPLDLAWRSSKWGLRPMPGFGGPKLSADELAKAGLAREAFAFRVQYIVTWGDEAATGRTAEKAGIKKDDIIVSVGGKRDFESVDHFQAWFRLTQRVGTTCEVEILRGGQRVKVMLPVIE